MLRIGIVGAGHLGKIHIKLLKEMSNFDLVGFYDNNEDVCNIVSKEFSISSYNSFNGLLEEVDAIDIVSPTPTHYEYASKALKKGKHVFIEKPISTTLEEAKKIVSLSNEANVKVQIGHIERFNPAFIAARPHISAPIFIEAHRLIQFNPIGASISVIHDLMIHDLDIILSLVKSDIKKISANGVSIVSDMPDIVNVRIEFSNGCVANLTSSRISMKNMSKISFSQKDAYITIDFLGNKSDIFKIKTLKGESNYPTTETIYLEKEKRDEQPFIELLAGSSTNSKKVELTSFYDSIVNNTETPVSAIDGLNSIDVAHKIIERMNPLPIA